MSNIVLATSSAAYEQRVRRAFGSEVGGTLRRWHDEIMLTNPARAVKELAAEGADVVGIGPNVDVQLALELARAFDTDHPEIPVIVITEPTRGFWQKALRAGVHDVLTTDAAADEIRRVFHRAVETSRRRRSNLLDEIGDSTPSGKVITLVAPKGGSGKTALATNLAMSLSKSGEHVVLIDLDLQFGDVAGCLNLRPETTIGDVASATGQLTPTTLKVFLTPTAGDLFVLCAPDSPAEGEEVDERTVDQVIRLLAEEFPFVIIDTSAGLTEATLAAIELSTDLLFVCDLSAAALRGMRKVTDALDRIGIDGPERHFVLNRADSRVGIEADEASAVVGLPIAASIPSSREVPLSMNQGITVVESAPRSPVGKSLAGTAGLFREAEEKQSRWSGKRSSG